MATSGDALWLAPVGLRVFATVDAQEGGGCRVANLGAATCAFCKDMVKNGGRGVQRCACLRKACLFLMATGGDGFTLREWRPV